MGTFLDCIIPCLDKIRQNAADSSGYRQYDVFLRTETWSGREKGEGNMTVTETQVLPPPLVVFNNAPNVYVEAGGREETQVCTMTEVSLRYTESQLLPTGLPKNVDFMYRLADHYSSQQGIADNFFVPINAPTADRVKTIGWNIILKQRTPSGG